MRLPKTLLRSIFAISLTMMLSIPSFAEGELEYRVRGVDDPLRSNILNHVSSVRFGRQMRPAEKDFERILNESKAAAQEALRPYGYYAAEIDGRIHRGSSGQPILELNVVPGPPIRIESLTLEIIGDGASSESLDRWKRNWPLRKGGILDQVVWNEQKKQAIEICNSIGFLGAEFTTRTLEINLDSNHANVKLVLDTGPRYVMGDIDFGEHVLNPGILEFVPTFQKGDPYSLHLMDRFRSDLWQTGYFTDVDVVQVEVEDAEPPRVDLQVRTSTDYRNRYTGALGFGSDTGLRLQANWSRHPMSARGDRLDLGIGWQELDDQFAARATYRLPRRQRNREYWTVDTVIRYENMDLEFKLEPEDDDFIKYASGDVDERHVRLGRLKIRNFGGGETQLFATPFVQYINSEFRFAPILQPITPINSSDLDDLLSGVDDAISVGVEFGLVNVLGKGFDIRGHRERAWAFHSNDSFGSEVEFTQAYISTNSSYRAGDRWKFIFRGEAGYTDAKVTDLTIDIGGGQLNLSETELPSFYRFKAGGSNSVRGYGFETLSNNDIGSNHIFTASAEVEFKVLEKWSAAFFVDTGNAFNDWSEPELKTGVGLGVRWYSIAGPIRIDVAQALDYTGDPWRVHFTFGVPLL